MQLSKFLKLMSMATLLALTYIHMQMQIVDLAYQGSRKEQQIRNLVEDNGSATYKILMLKSANHLGITMLENNADMQFADARDIVEIAATEVFPSENQLVEHPSFAKKTNSLLSLLSFGVEAEAKTAK